MDLDEKYAVLDRLFDAVSTADVEGVRATYHDDVAVWHANSNSAQDMEENLGALSWMGANLTGIRYDDIRRVPMDDGKVFQRHVLRATTPSGTKMEAHACFVFTFAHDGRLLRLEEYLDSGQVAPIMEGAGLDR